MARRVLVEMPDGTIQPVENVPDNISNDSVAKRYNGRVMGKAEDIVRSGLSGVPFGVSQLALLPLKAAVGTGLALGDESLKPVARRINEKEKGFLEASGGGYMPRTGAGETAKTVTAAAVPIPGLGPIGTQMMLGGASGFASDLAYKNNLGTGGAIAASFVPYLAHGAYKGLQPVQPGVETRRAWNDMLPQEHATMQQRLLNAQEYNLPLMPWQAAPEGSPLRVLGQKVAGSSSSYPVRAIQGKQALEVTGNRALTEPTQSATTKIASPKYRTSAEVPISPEQVAEIRQSILDMKKELNIPPGSAKAKIFDSMAESFGRYEAVAPQTIIDEVSKQIANLPRNSPERIAAMERLKSIYAGEVPQRFVPAGIDNYGHIQSLYQDVSPKNLDAGVNVDKFTKLKVREAIARVADKYNPLFPEARKTYRDVNDIVKAVESTDRRGSGGLNIASEAKTELAPDLALAAGANPIWAMVPWLRERVAKASVAKYNKGFASTDMKDLENLAYSNPRQEAIQSLFGGLLQPAKQGDVTLPESDTFTEDMKRRRQKLYSGLLPVE